MPPVSVMIKPSSSNCNLRCKYCFYHSIADNRQTPSYGFMTEETLEEIVKKVLDFADQACTIAFQGGEPTLAGLDFFKKLINQIIWKYSEVQSIIKKSQILTKNTQK